MLSATTRAPRLPKYLVRVFSSEANRCSASSPACSRKGVRRRKAPSSTMPCIRICRSARLDDSRAILPASSAYTRSLRARMQDAYAFMSGNPLEGLADGGLVYLQSNLAPEKVWSSLPESARQEIHYLQLA